LQQVALKNEVRHQSENPPLTKEEWKRHISKCLLPVGRYITSRFGMGNISEVSDFYRGDRVFGPLYANTIAVHKGYELVDKLVNYPYIN
jgi:hypothetical protein